jgi:hypothetical protein
MRSILDGPDWDDPDTGSCRWNAVIDQAGPSYVWEWLIMDRTAPWADLFAESHAGRSPSRSRTRFGAGVAVASRRIDANYARCSANPAKR